MELRHHLNCMYIQLLTLIMPAIRRRFNYGIVYLNPDVKTGNPLCGQTVPVTDGCHTTDIHFAGFLSITEVPSIEGVMISGIDSYTEGDWLFGHWVNYGREDWLLGHHNDEGIYLLLHHDKPVVINRNPEPQPSSTKGNVFSITSGSGPK